MISWKFWAHFDDVAMKFIACLSTLNLGHDFQQLHLRIHIEIRDRPGVRVTPKICRWIRTKSSGTEKVDQHWGLAERVDS